MRNPERVGRIRVALGENQRDHATGYAPGFSGISGLAKPRIRPTSEESLEIGMVLNVEPAVYLEDYGGIRQYDMVPVTEAGAEFVIQLPCGADELARERIRRGYGDGTLSREKDRIRSARLRPSLDPR